MGFLFGTAFAVFYALFGIPLGKLADVWTRRTLIAVSLAFWSAATARLGPRAQLHRTRCGTHRRRHRRGRRHAGGLLAAHGLLPRRASRDGARALLERHLSRRGARPVDRRADRRSLGRGVSGRRRRPSDWRGWQVAFFVVGTARTVARALGPRRCANRCAARWTRGRSPPEAAPVPRARSRTRAPCCRPRRCGACARSGAGARGLAINGAAALAIRDRRRRAQRRDQRPEAVDRDGHRSLRRVLLGAGSAASRRGQRAR